MRARSLFLAALAVLFIVSLAGLVGHRFGIAVVDDSPVVLAFWLGATVMTAAGFALLALRRPEAEYGDAPSQGLLAAQWGEIIDTLPTALAIYDPERRLVFRNRPWRRIFADLDGFAALGSTYDDVAARVSKMRVPGGPTASLAGERQLESGEWVRFDEISLDDGLLMVSATDITRERANAQEVRIDRARSRLIISAAAAWIWETDVLHRFSMAAPARSELSRDELEWLIGRGIAELASPSGAAGDAALSKCIEDMQEHRRISDVTLVFRDGKRSRAVRLSGVPRIDNDGAFLGYCGIGVFDPMPAKPAAVTAPLKRARVGDPPDPRGQQVLLVDDSQTNRLLGVSILKKMGYECDAVENGQEAVEAVQEGRYGLVLMDIRMPGMDGFEATAQIRSLPEPLRSVPIVAMTAHVNAEDRQLCLESGMDDHVSKPVDRRILSTVVQRLIGPPGAKPAERAPTRAAILPEDADDAPAGTAAETALVDEQTLEQLRSDAGPALVTELIASFMTETDERQSRMRTALQSGDLDSVATEAHAMKSSSGTFGAKRLQSLAERLEAAANAKDASQASELMGALPDVVTESWRRFSDAGYPPPE